MGGVSCAEEILARPYLILEIGGEAFGLVFGPGRPFGVDTGLLFRLIRPWPDRPFIFVFLAVG